MSYRGCAALWSGLLCLLLGCGGGQNVTPVPPPAPPIVVTLSASSVPLGPGQTTTFTATVTGTTNTAVTWSLVETGGGNITNAGVYTAPATAGSYHVVATSAADPSKSAQATVIVTTTLLRPIITYNPSALNGTVGTALTAVTPINTGGVAASWSISPALPTGLLFTPTTGRISGTPTAASTTTTYTVTATNTAGDDTTQVTLTIAAVQVVVEIGPTRVDLQTNHSATFRATVTGTSNTNVTWSITETSGGAITSGGIYTAPATAGTYHVVATSVADASKSAQATVTVSDVVVASRYPGNAIQSPLTPMVAQRLRAIFDSGTALGQRANVFIKVGDSITVNSEFMSQFIHPAYNSAIHHGWDYTHNLGAYPELQAARQHFLTGSIGSTTPYDRVSLSARVGEGSAWPVTPLNSGPLAQEITAAQGAFALIMLGTNDVRVSNSDAACMGQIIQQQAKILDVCLASGVVPILFAAPKQPDDANYSLRLRLSSRLLRGLAQGRQVPFVNFHEASLPLPRSAFWDDGIHLSSLDYNKAAWLTSEGIAFAQNLRNLLSMQALNRLYRLLVLSEAAPDVPMASIVGSGTSGDPYVVDSADFTDFRQGSAEAHYRWVVDAPADFQLAVVGLQEGDTYKLELLNGTTVVATASDGVLARNIPAGTYTVRVSTTHATPSGFVMAIL